MLASERYYALTKKRYVYSIMPIANIPSVLQYGIVCFDQVQRMQHSSIAMDEVQARRSNVEIPNGLPLHQYANLYFSFHNPMLYKRKDIAGELCILAFSSAVMDIEGCILTDRNAATSLVRFFSPLEGVEKLDFAKIHAQYWTDPDPIIQREKKAIKCAEVLIPHCISADYIVGAYAVSHEVEAQLRDFGFNKSIVVNTQVFYR